MGTLHKVSMFLMFNMEIILDLHKVVKIEWRVPFPLYPTLPHANILHNHGTLINTHFNLVTILLATL